MSHDQPNTRALFRKRPPDRAMYDGPIRVSDDDATHRTHPDDALAAMLLRVTNPEAAVLWINPSTIPAARYRLIELWARRVLALGKHFAMLTQDDLRAVPGLFESTAA